MAYPYWSFLILFAYLVHSSSAAPTNDALEVVIDTDLGADDAMAVLLMLSKLSRANVLALTAVTGNTGAVNVTRNVLLTLQVADRTDIPVYTGSEQGLVYKQVPTCYFGCDGLGDVFHNKPSLELRKEEHAALALANIVKERPGRVTVVCIGPLTNLALALHIYPRLLEDVKNVVILGGSYLGGGGVKPGVEFNTYSDPEAAAYVFSKVPVDKPVTVVPSETTHGVSLPLDWRINTLGKIDTCAVEFMNKAERISLKKERVWGLADQVAVSIVLNPTIVKATKEAYLLVETCGDTGRGAVFRDDYHKTPNVKLVTEVDKDSIEELLIEYLSSYPKECQI